MINEFEWRSDWVTDFFVKLDSAHEDRKSEQAKHQTKPRICNGTSIRVAPPHLLFWALNNHSETLKMMDFDCKF